MARAPFNDVVSVYGAPSGPTPGVLLGTFPCRFVLQTSITDIYPSQVTPVAWFTVPTSCQLGYFTSVTADSFMYHYDGCDQLQFDSFVGETFIPVSWEIVSPRGRPAYHRYNLVSLALWPGIPKVAP